MGIQVKCPSCGKSLKARDSFAGKTARCPSCKGLVPIPAAEEMISPLGFNLLDEAVAQTNAVPKQPAQSAALPGTDGLAPLSAQLSASVVSATPVAQPRVKESSESGADQSRGLYYVFVLMLIPLAISIFRGHDSIEERLINTIKDHPEIRVRLGAEGRNFSLPAFFDMLPGKKIIGAHLPYGSWVHWYYAIASAALFGTALYALFPTGKAKWMHTAMICLATSTFGIVFLISLQWITALAGGWLICRSIIIMIVFYIVKFIGFSYHAALDANTGFWLSFLGFTFGVGLCEELTKALPLLFHFRSKATLDWRGACMWGLASGVGFGIAEGIIYSADFYNGLAGTESYIVRFVSCVAMHAIWTASAAIMIWRRREWFARDCEWTDLAVSLLWVLAVPMVLHGLYDTLLKREMAACALLTALASFGWLALVMEWNRVGEGRKRSGVFRIGRAVRA